MFNVRLYIKPDNFTWDSSTYTSNRFDAQNPENPAPPLQTYGDGTWVAPNASVYINNTMFYAPAYRFNNVDTLNNNVFTITLVCLTGYRITLNDARYGVSVNDTAGGARFTSNHTYNGVIPNGLISLNSDSTRMTISYDIRNLLYCDGNGYPYYDLSASSTFLQLVLAGIGFEEIPVGTYYTITQNLTGCTSDYNKASELENTLITINLTPNTNHLFLTIPSYTIGGVTYQFTETQTGYTATFILTNDVTISANAVECYPITQNITNATSNYTLGYIIAGQTVSIVITPNVGYYFPTGSCTYIDSNGVTSPMSIVNGEAVCSFYVDSIYQYSGQVINANAIKQPTEKYGFIGIYNPTLSQLITLSQQRFVNPQQGLVDLTGYVISLKKYYCNVTIDGSENVYYGTHNTNVMCNTIDTKPFELDCGNVEIDELYNNTLDYDNTQIEIYLPFIGNVTLNTKRVMGKTVSLIYKVNPINGDCVVILYDSISDIIIESGNISFQIPIKEHETSIYVNNYNENPLFMASLTPQIRIETDEIYNDNPLHGFDNNLWVQISDCNGYVMFSDIDFRPINKINKDEYDEIVALLKRGIIV